MNHTSQIDPKVHPRALTIEIVTYIAEEVRRQGHDLGDPLDGGVRVAGMCDAWRYAMERSTRRPSAEDVRVLGLNIEACNVTGFRTVPVFIARSMKPPTRLLERVNVLLQNWHATEPLDLYRTFEEIHPFSDGNGRTGKVLLNWRAGTLEHPFFPPSNFWGREIQNP